MFTKNAIMETVSDPYNECYADPDCGDLMPPNLFLHATRDAQAKLVCQHHAFATTMHSFLLPQQSHTYFIKTRPGFRDFDVAGAFDSHLYMMAMHEQE